MIQGSSNNYAINDNNVDSFIDTLTRQQLLIGGGDPLEDIQKFKSEG